MAGLLTGLGLALIGVQADGVVTNCSEAALDSALAGGGRVVFACGGVITTHTAKVIEARTVLEANGHRVVLSGGSSNRLFTINPDTTLELHGLTLAYGSHAGAAGRDGTNNEEGDNGKPGFGGAVFNDRGALVAVQVTFATNQVTGGSGGQGTSGLFLGTNGRSGGGGGSGSGGAIFNRGGSLLLTNCVFTGNQATGGSGGNGGDGADNLFLKGSGGNGGGGGPGRGGAIFSEQGGTVVLMNCSFGKNQTTGEAGGAPGLAGGGTKFHGSPGSAGSADGGAIFVDAGHLTGLHSTFDQNGVQGADGLDGLDGFNSRKGMDGRSGGNGRGGALAVIEGTLAFTNCTFFSNRASGGDGGDGGDGGTLGFGGDGGDGGSGGHARGGATYHERGSLATYVHCTFSTGELHPGQGGAKGAAGAHTANSGATGSAGSAQGGNLATAHDGVELLYTLLAYAHGGPNVGGPAYDGGFNLSSDETPAFDHEGSLGRTDPLLENLAYNGGPTQTAALSPNSPARDRGSGEVLIAVDQRGSPRDDTPDAGAYEYNSSPRLQISVDGDRAILAWPVTAPPFQLQSTVSLLPVSWQVVPGMAQVGSLYVITNAITGTARFYRLTPGQSF